VVDTAFDDGVLQEKHLRTAKAVKRGKLSIEEIAEDFEIGKDAVLLIKNNLGL
jgi:predicted DNA-binding protein YlxM (UPF0122 family)